MSHLLELLGRGLDRDVGDVLDRYFWSPQTRSVAQLVEDCRNHPQVPELRLKLGLAHLRAVQLDEAVEHLSSVCRERPDLLAARLALAAALDERGDCGEALDELQTANRIRPGEAPVLFAMGFCCEKLRRTDEAREYYRDALKRDEGCRAARLRLAAAAIAQDDVEEAIVQYRADLDADPQRAETYGALGHLLHRAGRHTEAVEAFEAAIALEPENWALIDDEVEALIADGQTREAIGRLEQLLERQGDFADLHCRIADLYGQVGDDDSAVTHYRRALDIEPDYLEAMARLGTHHLSCGRWEEAAEAFHRALEQNDQLLTHYVGLGVAQAAAGERDRAIDTFELAGAVEPNSSVLLCEVARLQLKAAAADALSDALAGEDDTALPEISLDNDDLLDAQVDRHAEQVEQFPERPDLHYRYGVLLRSQGRLGESIREFSQAVELHPAYVQALIKLGITQQELGLLDEAIASFRAALEIEPHYVDLHYRLGVLYTDRREFDKAVRHMEAAADGAPHNASVRASLALSLQNMKLMDEAAATWRDLARMQKAQR